MTTPSTDSQKINTAQDAMTVFMMLPEQEVKSLICNADELLALNQDTRDIVLKQIRETAKGNGSDNMKPSEQAQGFNDWLQIPENERYYLKPTAGCDESCVKNHNEEVKNKTMQQSLHIVLGVFSPSTKLKLFGPQSLTEGKLLGEGRDSVVYMLKGESDWVIKVLKFGGAERAELLAHYINQLAQEVRLKIEPVISLGDGRLLQRFVEGTPIANQLWGKYLLDAQKMASEMTALGREKLGLTAGKTFIQEGQVKISIDPSYANHMFEEAAELRYKGNIDPIYTITEHAPKR